jgi:hypothetical protein
LWPVLSAAALGVADVGTPSYQHRCWYSAEPRSRWTQYAPASPGSTGHGARRRPRAGGSGAPDRRTQPGRSGVLCVRAFLRVLTSSRRPCCAILRSSGLAVGTARSGPWALSGPGSGRGA